MQNLILNRSRMVLEKVTDKIPIFGMLELSRVLWLQQFYMGSPSVAGPVERRTENFRNFSDFLKSCKIVGNHCKWPYKCIGGRIRPFWVYFKLCKSGLGMCMCTG